MTVPQLRKNIQARITPSGTANGKPVYRLPDGTLLRGHMMGSAAEFPGARENCGRQEKLKLTAVGCKLRPLLCTGWQLIQNTEFKHLTIYPSPGTAKTAEKWLAQFGRLGQDINVLVTAADFTVSLYRPVCTFADRHKLEFHYLNRRPSVVVYAN